MKNDSPISESFSAHLRHALLNAIQFAEDFGHEQVSSLHLLFGLATQKGSLSAELLSKADFPVDLLKQELIRSLHRPYLSGQSEAVLSDDVITILTKSIRTAQLYGHTYVGTEHVLACFIHLADQYARELFSVWQISLSDLQRQLLTVLKSTSKFPDLTDSLRDLQQLQQEDVTEDIPDFPALESVAKELTTEEATQEMAPLIGREKELKRLQQILSRRYKNNPLLIGNPGVGKSALVEGLAKSIVNGSAPLSLSQKRIFHLEMSSLVAGTMYRGDFEQRLKAIIDECQQNPDIILFIDEIHTLVGAGSTGQALDAANILKPALARGEIRCIGATTFKEYQSNLKKDGALTRRFDKILIHQPSKEETMTILNGMKSFLEDYHQVRITKKAIESAVNLSERYLSHQQWPDKAIDLLDASSAHKTMDRVEPESKKKERSLKKRLKKLQGQKAICLEEDCYEEALQVHKKMQTVLEQLSEIESDPIKRETISEKHVFEALQQRLDVSLAEQSSTVSSSKLYSLLTADVIGQSQSLKVIAQHLQHGFSPLKQEQQPLGAFLLAGPSGVGKTSTAKSLAKHLFGSEKALIRLDMSEYAEKHTIAKLIGSPAGYVGYQQSGLLTELLEEQPHAVILFDEVEKAHPDLFNLLLQILDEGRLRDASGSLLDFSQSIILLTTNLGNEDLAKQVGFANTIGNERLNLTDINPALRLFFKQELLNRLDAILTYQQLNEQDRLSIAKKKLDEIQQRLAQYATIEVEQDVFEHLAITAYQPTEGIRSILRNLKRDIEFPLSEQLSKRKKSQHFLVKKQENGSIVLTEQSKA